MLSKRCLALAAVLLGLVASEWNPASAGVLSFSIDTSGVAGTTGGIYFQFNPGLASDPATVVVDNFVIGAPGGLLSGTPVGALFPAGSDGDVLNSLDNLPLVLRNTFGLNDYLHYLSFGSLITFTLDLQVPNPVTGDPSSLGVEITGADGLGSVFPVDDQNFNVQITFDSRGKLIVTNTTPLIQIGPAGVPEPGTALLAAAAIALALVRNRRAS